MSKDVSVNRKAFHNYEIIEKYEAGIVLTGTEIKSAREGLVNLKDAYGIVKGGEVWLLNCHISPYSHGNYANHEPLRTRKLLMKHKEILRWMGKTMIKGLTIIPLEIYFNKRGKAKVSLALAKGKRGPDRREEIKRRTLDRELRKDFAGKQKIK